MDLHHPLIKEFPDHVDVIRRLKLADEHFRNLFNEYHTVDDKVCRIEEEVETATDQETDELKMRRAWLKDRLYQAITQAASAPAGTAKATAPGA